MKQTNTSYLAPMFMNFFLLTIFCTKQLSPGIQVINSDPDEQDWFED